jgi:hypothetical protein
MSGNIAFVFMVIIYGGLTFGVAVLAWSRGYNTGRSEAVVKIERRLRAVK